MRVLLRSNDRRVVRVEVGELHPSSRIRNAIERDVLPRGKRVLCVNASADVLLSLIASQRLNSVVCKPGVSHDEVVLELDRDCVDVPFCALRDDDVVVQAADALMRFWRLERVPGTLARGRTTDWFTTPSTVLVQFAPKPARADLRQRCGDKLLFYFVACLHEETDFATAVGDEARAQTVSRLSTELTARPFWHVRYDEAMHGSGAAAERWVEDVVSMCGRVKRMDEDDPCATAIRRALRRLHAAEPALHQVFACLPGTSELSAEQRRFNQVLRRKYNARVVHWCSHASDAVPLVFPTHFLRAFLKPELYRGPTCLVELPTDPPRPRW